MSANTGAGIQELMAAETRASQIVAEARMGTSWVVWFLCHVLCCYSEEVVSIGSIWLWMFMFVCRCLVVLLGRSSSHTITFPRFSPLNVWLGCYFLNKYCFCWNGVSILIFFKVLTGPRNYEQFQFIGRVTDFG